MALEASSQRRRSLSKNKHSPPSRQGKQGRRRCTYLGLGEAERRAGRGRARGGPRQLGGGPWLLARRQKGSNRGRLLQSGGESPGGGRRTVGEGGGEAAAGRAVSSWRGRQKSLPPRELNGGQVAPRAPAPRRGQAGGGGSSPLLRGPSRRSFPDSWSTPVFFALVLMVGLGCSLLPATSPRSIQPSGQLLACLSFPLLSLPVPFLFFFFLWSAPRPGFPPGTCLFLPPPLCLLGNVRLFSSAPSPAERGSGAAAFRVFAVEQLFPLPFASLDGARPELVCKSKNLGTALFGATGTRNGPFSAASPGWKRLS